jgi:hypothetical protein
MTADEIVRKILLLLRANFMSSEFSPGPAVRGTLTCAKAAGVSAVSRQYRKLAEMYWALAHGEEPNRSQPSKMNVKRSKT